MLSLRRLPRRIQPSFRWRGNASLAADPDPSPPAIPSLTSSTTPLEETPKSQGRRTRKGTPRTRPPISSNTPRKWNRPLAEGVLPAYDLALKVLATDSVELKNQAKQLGSKIEQAESEWRQLRQREQDELVREQLTRLDIELEQMRRKLDILEVQSDINLPEVRWSVANAMVDMTKPAHRRLLEQRWRNDGDLDLLMERIYQMKVFPDVLPKLNPSIDVRISVPSTHGEFKKTKKDRTPVVPGVFLLPEQTTAPPRLFASVFHTDTRLYTMLLIDPDVPDEENETFTTYLHWLRPNVPLSATHTGQIMDLNTHTTYIPPHPQKGTPYHRYVLLLLPQPPLGAPFYSLNMAARAEAGIPTSVHLDIPVIPDEERLGFDVRAFASHWDLDSVDGGGLHMWREVWDEKVSEIYESKLKLPEPRYARPPKADPYAKVKRSKKYIL